MTRRVLLVLWTEQGIAAVAFARVCVLAVSVRTRASTPAGQKFLAGVEWKGRSRANVEESGEHCHGGVAVRG
jgi:hypothetical protein